MTRRKWTSVLVVSCEVAEGCERLTDEGWSVHTIYFVGVADVHGRNTYGSRIVAFKDEPDLSGGVPR